VPAALAVHADTDVVLLEQVTPVSWHDYDKLTANGSLMNILQVDICEELWELDGSGNCR
jgi:hypothetical protein